MIGILQHKNIIKAMAGWHPIVQTSDDTDSRTIALSIKNKIASEDAIDNNIIPWQGWQDINRTFEEELESIDIEEIRQLIDDQAFDVTNDA